MWLPASSPTYPSSRLACQPPPVLARQPPSHLPAGQQIGLVDMLIEAVEEAGVRCQAITGRRHGQVQPEQVGGCGEAQVGCDNGPMMIKQIIPNLNVTDATAGHEFYTEFLGLQKAFDLGWIASFRSPANQAAQVSLVSGDATAREDSVLSVGVDDVDAAYALAQRLGYEIIHPLTDEAWGVRRFFVRDPHGNVINIVAHPD